MSKEDEIMEYLHAHVFDPILNSPIASTKIKEGVRLTIIRMRQRNATGMLTYYWSAIIGTEKSTRFAQQMKAEHFTRFEECIDEFRERFSDKWLKS